MPREERQLLIEQIFGAAITILGTLMLAIGSYTASMIKDMSNDIKSISQVTTVLAAQRVSDSEQLKKLEFRIDRAEAVLIQMQRK